MLLTNPELITLTEESLYDPAPVPKLDHYRDLFNLLMSVVGYRTVGKVLESQIMQISVQQVFEWTKLCAYRHIFYSIF